MLGYGAGNAIGFPCSPTQVARLGAFGTRLGIVNDISQVLKLSPALIVFAGCPLSSELSRLQAHNPLLLQHGWEPFTVLGDSAIPMPIHNVF